MAHSVKAIALILLSAFSCFGQAFTFNDLAFVCQTNVAPPAGWGSPTNNTDGTLPISWYVGDYYSTNTTPILPDLWTNAFNLTNLASSGAWPAGVITNGHTYLSFDGTADYLKSVNYTSSQPHEVVMVVSYTGPANTRIMDSANATYRQYVQYTLPTLPATTLYAGTVHDFQFSSGITNRWIVLDVQFAGAQSRVITNGVQANAVGDAGTSTISGLTIAGRYDLANYLTMKLAEMITYSQTNNLVQRSNIFTYLTNKWSFLMQ